MKKYIKPEMNVELFKNEDILTASAETGIFARLLKTEVNGHEGEDYGSQEVSVFEKQEKLS